MSLSLSPDSLTDWIQLMFTITAGLYALYLLKQSNKDKKAKFINEIYRRFYDDTEIRMVLYSIDSGKNQNEIGFGKKMEQETDKTLHFLNYIGYLIKVKHLNKSDICSFRYEINRILSNSEVKKYIDDWLRKIGVGLDNLEYIKDFNC